MCNLDSFITFGWIQTRKSDIIFSSHTSAPNVVHDVEPSFDRLRIVVYYLYILFCDKAFFYVGVTSDSKRRLRDHKSGFSSHTKRYKTIELVYKEEYSTRSVAEELEKQIKGWSRAKKKALIRGNINRLQELSRSKS